MSEGFAVSVQLPDGAHEEIRVENTRSLIIGRDPSCHVVLPSPAVSRRHLRIQSCAEGLRVTDHSANGTTMGDNSVRLPGAPLPRDAALRVGPYILRVTLLPAAGLARGSAEKVARSSDTQVERQKATACVSPELRKRVHRLLLDYLELASLERAQMDDAAIRPRVIRALERILSQLDGQLPTTLDKQQLVKEMTDEVLGFGPIQGLLDDDSVSEIMVIDPETIYVERNGKISLTDLQFTDDESCRAAIERIVTPLGRRIDESTPLVDARLKDGSRVNAIIPPLAIKGPCITIRKFGTRPLRMADLVASGSLNHQMVSFLQRSVLAKKNMLISGGTGSGKTTLLNVLSTAIPAGERIVTIEDAAELQLHQPHVVSLESKPPNMEGRGGYTIRDLVKNALRMRPDRILVGECRAGEAIDMLQAMNTGHEGSMTTTHANSAREALQRVETLCMMAGLDLPSRVIRDQVAGSVHLVVQQTRFSDGSRRVTSVSEVGALDDDGEIVLHDIFAFHRTGTTRSGRVLGEYRTTGYVPSFLDEFIAKGLVSEGDYL